MTSGDRNILNLSPPILIFHHETDWLVHGSILWTFNFFPPNYGEQKSATVNHLRHLEDHLCNGNGIAKPQNLFIGNPFPPTWDDFHDLTTKKYIFSHAMGCFAPTLETSDHHLSADRGRIPSFWRGWHTRASSPSPPEEGAAQTGKPRVFVFFGEGSDVHHELKQIHTMIVLAPDTGKIWWKKSAVETQSFAFLQE